MKQLVIIFIYCESGDHSTNKCTRVLEVASRRKYLDNEEHMLQLHISRTSSITLQVKSMFQMRKKHHTSICESTQSSIDNLSIVNKSSQDTMKLDARAKEQPAEKNMSGMTESLNTIRPTLLATWRNTGATTF